MNYLTFALILLFFGFIAYLGGVQDGKQSIMNYLSETDGFNTYNYICYYKSEHINRTQYIIDHELCHDIVKNEYEDYCK